MMRAPETFSRLPFPEHVWTSKNSQTKRVARLLRDDPLAAVARENSEQTLVIQNLSQRKFSAPSELRLSGQPNLPYSELPSPQLLV